ncbi:MAG: hypothetical protein LAO22_22860, partial [Acidobacteriia bacterium]|nr:hypothetical protein [Terriglobia bacterium]
MMLLTLAADCGRVTGKPSVIRKGESCRPSNRLDYEAEEKELRTASYYRVAFGSADCQHGLS